MRGHQHLKVVVQENAQGAKTVQKRILPGYLEERILEPEKYYVKNIYLDALKSIDALRLNRKLDCGSVAVIGKGLGAAAAIFTAAYSSRVSAIVIDSPSFSYLDESQNESRGEIAEEITGYIERNPTKRNVVKRSLSYFDALAFTDRVKCPVMFSIGLKDDIAPPQCSFALFNHLICDKEIQVYPDEGNEAGGEKQFKKALRWIKSQISPTE
jgi:cephalosporin-C deacetylase